MQTTQEVVINVQEIEPRLRHTTIFQVFDHIKDGESFVIHNNHDPMPVYYQLQQIRGDVFDWEYLQEGPEWWDIRVTKRKAQPSVYTSENGETVINVPSLEPRIKHSTIFSEFEKLTPGKSLIIHNDHDPQPLHYHLSSEHGDIFTWEYLQEGPQWWDVRITIKGAPQQEAKQATNGTAKKEDIVINVPSLEPKLKHPTIFKTFDSLKEGESLVIHNDHDPKPVYYQLQSEKGDVFTWEYLQQGPQWWDIRVTRKGVDSGETIGEIVAKDFRKAEVFNKHGIDFCCGGKKTVREICKEKGIDAAIVEKELQQQTQSATSNSMNFNEWNLDFLSDYIVNMHHKYVRKYSPELRGYAAKVAQVHGTHHPELLTINQLVQKTTDELSEHMVSEEKYLFPLVKNIVLAKEGKAQYSKKGSFEDFITKHEKEHQSVGDDIDEIRRLSNNFAIPEDACTSYKLLYKMLDEFEHDLHTHIHLENNILFPKAIEIERTLS